MKIELNPDMENLPVGVILIEAKHKETGRRTMATVATGESIDARKVFTAAMPLFEIINASYVGKTELRPAWGGHTRASEAAEEIKVNPTPKGEQLTLAKLKEAQEIEQRPAISHRELGRQLEGRRQELVSKMQFIHNGITRARIGVEIEAIKLLFDQLDLS